MYRFALPIDKMTEFIDPVSGIQDPVSRVSNIKNLNDPYEILLHTVCNYATRFRRNFIVQSL